MLCRVILCYVYCSLNFTVYLFVHNHKFWEHSLNCLHPLWAVRRNLTVWLRISQILDVIPFYLNAFVHLTCDISHANYIYFVFRQALAAVFWLPKNELPAKKKKEKNINGFLIHWAHNKDFLQYRGVCDLLFTSKCLHSQLKYFFSYPIVGL